MRRADTIPAAAKVVQLEPRRNPALFSLVIPAVRRYQSRSHPEPRVPVILNDREEPALRGWIDRYIRLVRIAPLGNFGVVVDAAAILFLCAKLHVIWVAARANSAKVVKGHALGDGAVPLAPIPTVGHVQLPIAMDSAVPIFSMDGHDPASGGLINGVARLLAVPPAIHLRLAGDVPKPRKLCDGCLPAASASANTAGVSDAARDRRHAVTLDESVVATPQHAMTAIGADCGLPSASAHAQAGWVRAARVVGLNRFASMRHAAVVAFQVAWLFREWVTASAFTRLRAWWPDQHGFSATRFGLVAVNEPAAARKSAVGTICDLAASALARLAKIDLGHLISVKDLWSAGTGVHALGQPFSLYNRWCRVVIVLGSARVVVG